MQLLEKLKSHSSKWIKTRDYVRFYWQRGYGAFSVNPTQVDVVKRYIMNQESHHKSKSYKEEFGAMLTK